MNMLIHFQKWVKQENLKGYLNSQKLEFCFNE